MEINISAGKAAFATTTLTAAVGIGIALTIRPTDSKIASIAKISFLITAGGLGIASITAWIASKKDDSAEDYFTRLKDHAGATIGATWQFAFQVILQEVIVGIGKAIGENIYNVMTGKGQKKEEKKQQTS